MQEMNWSFGGISRFIDLNEFGYFLNVFEVVHTLMAEIITDHSTVCLFKKLRQI